MRIAQMMLAAALRPRRAGRGFAAEASDDPVRLVRTMEMLHDQMARGTPESENARRALVVSISTRMLAADPAIWRDSHNVDAALLYVLSGGNPAVLDRLSETQDATRLTLVAAIRAYATGSPAEAKRLWEGVDLGALPVGLIGAAALAKATLLTEDDPQQAMRFVDMARLEAPGTLIEEAAVRRGIEIAAKLGDQARFEFLSTRYASRFPRSMYGEAFRRRFSEYYLAIATEKEGQLSPKLETILAPLSDTDRRAIFLEIARLALSEERRSSEDPRPTMQRLFRQTAPSRCRGRGSIRSRRRPSETIWHPCGLALESLAQGDLPPRDRALLDAVSTLLGEIERWPPAKDEPPPVEGFPTLGRPAVRRLGSRTWLKRHAKR